MAHKKQDALMQTDCLELMFDDSDRPTQEELIVFAEMTIELLKIGKRLNDLGLGFSDKEELTETLNDEVRKIQFELKQRKDMRLDIKRYLLHEAERLALSTISYYGRSIKNTANSHARKKSVLTNEQKAEKEKTVSYLQARKIPLSEQQLKGLENQIIAGATWEKDFSIAVMDSVSAFLKMLEKGG